MTENCQTCRFRKPDERPEYADAGFCRRLPPVPLVWVTMLGEPYYEQSQPWVQANEWCGEYQRNPA